MRTYHVSLFCLVIFAAVGGGCANNAAMAPMRAPSESEANRQLPPTPNSPNGIPQVSPKRKKQDSSSFPHGCAWEYGVGSVIGCNLYDGETYNWTNTVTNSNGADLSGFVCGPLTFNPPTNFSDQYISVTTLNPTINAIGPCATVTTPYTVQIKMLQFFPNAEGATVDQYYTIQSCDPNGNCGNSTWHGLDNDFQIIDLGPAPSPSPNMTPSPTTPTPLPSPSPSPRSRIVAKIVPEPGLIMIEDDEPADGSSLADRQATTSLSSFDQYCSGRYNVFPRNHKLDDPKSPLYYSLHIACYDDRLSGFKVESAKTVISSYEFNTRKLTAGSSNPATVDEELCTLITTSLFYSECETPAKPLSNPAGRSSLLRLRLKLTASNQDVGENVIKGYFPVNDRNVNYPSVIAEGGFGEVLFPKPQFLDCSSNTRPGCATRKQRQFLDNVDAEYGIKHFEVPQGAGENPPTFDAHHIKPLRWGGTNDGDNGVFLTNRQNLIQGGTDEHQIFSTWWCGFSLPGSTADNECKEDGAGE